MVTFKGEELSPRVVVGKTKAVGLKTKGSKGTARTRPGKAKVNTKAAISFKYFFIKPGEFLECRQLFIYRT